MTVAFRSDLQQRASAVASVPGQDRSWAQSHRGRRRILMLSTAFKMPYRVMRCVAECGAEVHALGSPTSLGLARSRFCRRFALAGSPIDGTGGEDLLKEINTRIADWDIDLVLAGDGDATRSLISLRDRLQAPCFPMPDAETFDLLNDKWRFHRLCSSIGILTPQTWLYRDARDLAHALKSEAWSGRRIAKPLSMSGGEGCIILEAGNARAQLRQIDYSPILVQEFVEGEDIGASVFCERGFVKGFIAHAFRHDAYRTFAAPEIRRAIETLTGSLAVDGVLNFDMRRTAEDHVYYLECNPRFFFKIAMSMLAGINFVALGLDDTLHGKPEAPPRTVRFPKALVAAPWRIEAESWTALKFVLADPLPYLREEFGYEKGAGCP